MDDEQRKIFDEFTEEIKVLSGNRITYGTGATPMILPYFDTVADGERAPVKLSSSGDFKFKLDALYGYVKNSGPGIATQESKLWEEKISSIPELKKIFDKTGTYGTFLKPEIWMPLHKEIIKILKELIING